MAKYAIQVENLLKHLSLFIRWKSIWNLSSSQIELYLFHVHLLQSHAIQVFIFRERA